MVVIRDRGMSLVRVESRFLSKPPEDSSRLHCVGSMGRDGFLCLEGLKMKDLKSCVVVLSMACARSSVCLSMSFYDCFDRRAKRLFLSLSWFGPSLSLKRAHAGVFLCAAASGAGLHSVFFFPLVSHSQNTYPHTRHTPTPHRLTHTRSQGQ